MTDVLLNNCYAAQTTDSTSLSSDKNLKLAEFIKLNNIDSPLLVNIQLAHFLAATSHKQDSTEVSEQTRQA